jgi:hypothetical protein
MNSLGIMIDANSRTLGGSTKLAKKQLDGDKNYINQYRAAAQFVANYEKNNGYGTSIYALATVYEKMRGDADTKPLVDAMIAAGEAAGAFNSETKRMQSALNSSLSHISASTQEAIQTVAPIDRQNLGLPSMAGISGKAVAMSGPGLAGGGWDAYFKEQMAAGEEFMAWYENMVNRTAMMNNMLEDSIIQSTTGGLQAFTDILMGVENADPSDVLAAFLQPFANTATQLGSLLLAEGIGIKAFKESLKSLNPAIAIGAGLALVALGSALGSAIQSLSGSGSSSSAVNGGYNSGSAGSSQSYSPELTVRIQGKLRGSDIVMSEENTKDKWNR